MCGIAGIIAESESIDKASIIKTMMSKLAHRGPDAEGYFNDKFASLGHRRLSIIDLSKESNQPMSDHTGRYVIVFNGEIYNFHDLRQDLNNVDFKTNSDTEVLLYGYIKYGKNILKHLDGMFAFAIYDCIKNELFIGRDRLGKKPLYYFHKEGLFVFASELRSILSSNLIPKLLDHDAIMDYFMFQSNTSPITIIKDVFQLMPGAYGIFNNTGFETDYYWRITDKREKIDCNPDKILKTTKQLLLEAVEKRLVSDVPLGVWLSGGIDSSSIVALMHENSSKQINSFSINFLEKEYDESEYSNLISKKYNTNHTTLYLNPNDLVTEFPKIINEIDTPNIDGANVYMISKLTKAEGITVILSGLGGDEVFGGYNHFNIWQTLNKYKFFWENSHALRKLMNPLVQSFYQGHSKTKILEFLNNKNINIAHIYPYFRMLFTAEELKNFDKNEKNVRNLVQKGLSEDNNILKFSSFSQLSIAELLSYTANTLLECTDRMSMAHALEVRVPFLDYQLIEYVLNVPDHFKHSNIPKKLLVDAMDESLPKEIVFRKKKGFSFPWEIWLRNQLKDLAEEYIISFSKREILDRSKVMELWYGFLSGNVKIRYSKILTFVYLEAWLQKNID